ncbi:MAG: 4-(cytidine 5'-diphospho)-2-C-methyl-D-erythritol kinase [Prevotellaceae bacterium]|jgi:4-diphosphocytidyl-2-C-methyl-D-erythritol kinase|nr:4-(cytidine 5'-diphospho)-2-C-methyl-D-erythritol kinase [Prevotellaceae bacterium]
MICFPPAKINIGLHIKARRPDGFHDIETLFYPVALYDVLEITTAEIFSIQLSGLPLEGDADSNLCVKAYRLLQTTFNLPPIAIHLHKAIPAGAGLGGGSSDATAMLQLLRDLFTLPLTTEQIRQYAVQLGSDCAFFLHRCPMLASGRGDILTAFPVPHLNNHFIILLSPPISVSTTAAYAAVTPQQPAHPLSDLLAQPIETWKNNIVNDFEQSIFLQHPVLSALKQKLYAAGAVYAAMSGSGAALFGLFPDAHTADRATKTLPEVFFCGRLHTAAKSQS